MRSVSRFALLVAALVAVSVPAVAQGNALYGQDGPKMDLSLGYQRIQANAPPGICQCFGANGGFVDVNWWFRPRLGVTAEFTGSHANNISNLGQNLTLMTFMAGPHVAYPIGRISLYGEVLLGGVHGSDSYFPTGNTFTTSASSFAFAPGGGIDWDVRRKMSIRLVQARYLHSTLPNGTTNEQNELMIGAGVVFRFGHSSRWPAEEKHPAPPPPPPAPEPAPAPAPPPPPAPMVTEMSCTSAVSEVQAGATVEVAAVTQTMPAGGMVTYSWTASGGNVLGSGARVTVDTASLPPGEYHVTGRAMLGGDAGSAKTCDVVFHVSAPAPPPAPTHEEVERDFHEHVHDVFFDLNKSNIRPDAMETLRKNAEYLAAHPRIRIVVQGYADERGSSKYNLALGERRVNAVRDELLRLGLSADRMQVVTFGRDAQICTASNEGCWQQNRRVGFLMQP